MIFEYISFKDGRCRRLRELTHQARADEAINACGATNTEANLLDEKYRVIGTIKHDHSLPGWVLSPVENPS